MDLTSFFGYVLPENRQTKNKVQTHKTVKSRKGLHNGLYVGSNQDLKLKLDRFIVSR